MAATKLRDRDAVVTDENIIFRIYGYSHPRGAYICDPEYAPINIYKPMNSRAYRNKGTQIYYKFYTDEGLLFIRQRYPQYTIWHEQLQKKLVGVKIEQIKETRQPDKIMQPLLEKQPTDILIQALHGLLRLILRQSSLSRTDFGVFGSLLHNFYHPKFSDIDLTIYGKQELKQLREALGELYREKGSELRNEFDTMEAVKDKHWKFQNYSMREYLWHQKRKQVYALFRHKESGRTIKTEFEPVKRWEEIQNEYNPNAQILPKGWIRVLARVTNDDEAPFMPSVYQIEPLEILKGEHVDNIKRLVSYVEEYRMQAQKDELVLVEGNLEQVNAPKQTFHQITLTYGPRYYEQTLKVVDQSARII